MLWFIDSPLWQASCLQVAQFDMSGQNLSLSRLSLNYWGAGDMTHTVIHIPAVSTGYPDKICLRNNKEEHWHWAMSHWPPLETCTCQMCHWHRKFVFCAITQQVNWCVFLKQQTWNVVNWLYLKLSLSILWISLLILCRAAEAVQTIFQHFVIFDQIGSTLENATNWVMCSSKSY